MNGAGRERRRSLALTAAVSVAVLIVSVLALLEPRIMTVMTRDTMAVRRGEWWRLLTPILVQPSGVLALAFLLLGFLVLIPAVGSRAGSATAAAAMVIGAVGALAISSWLFPVQTGGGSSGAVAALVGAWAVCLTRGADGGPRAYLVTVYAGFFAVYLVAAAGPFTTVAPLIGNAAAVTAFALHRNGRPGVVAAGVLACGVVMTALLDEHGFGVLLGAAVAVASRETVRRPLLNQDIASR